MTYHPISKAVLTTVVLILFLGPGYYAMPTQDVQAAKNETVKKEKNEAKEKIKKEKNSKKKEKKAAKKTKKKTLPKSKERKSASNTIKVPPAPDAGVARNKSKKPNFILIVTDDQTYESLAKMPYLSSRKDWIFFNKTYQNVSLCCSSRATILTGQYDTHTGVLSNNGEYDVKQFNDKETLAKWLNRKGYKTALMGKYLNGYTKIHDNRKRIPPGWDKWFAFFGKADYYGYPINDNGEVVEYKGKDKDLYSTDVLADEAVKFIKDSKNKPFFLYWAPKTPHVPFIPAKRHKGEFKNEPIPNNPNINEADVSDKPAFVQAHEFVDDSEVYSNRRAQWEMLLAVDEAIKRFEKVLKKEGKADNTVIIFTSDNGYTFGEHRLTGKRCQYDACLQVPLAIYYPGAQGRTMNNLVSNIDIAPTIAELAGAHIPISVDGVSLVPLIEGRAGAWRDSVLSHWGGGDTVAPHIPNFWTVRTDSYRYTELITGEKELYDYFADPYELENKANDPAYAAIQSDMKNKLDTLISKAKAPSIKANGNSRAAVEDVTNTTVPNSAISEDDYF